jgi:drug/metabolite transporter (DMT)-like permease
MILDRNRSRDLPPALVVGVVAVFWGCWWIPLRLIDQMGLTGPWAGAAIYSVAGLALLPAAIAKGWLRGATGLATLAIGTVYGIQLSTFSIGVVLGEIMRVVLLYYTLPVWGTLFAILLLGERLTPLRAAAVALGVLGAVVVLNEGGLPIPRSIGDWMGLATGVIFALATALSRRHPGVGGLASAFVTFATAGPLCAVIALVLLAGEVPAAATFAAALPWVAGVALLLAIPSYALVIWAAGRIDPGRVSILLLIEVIAAAVTASLLLDEPFGLKETLGCGLIVAAGICRGVDQSRAASRARPHRASSAS